jgi:hypothetical protein
VFGAHVRPCGRAYIEAVASGSSAYYIGIGPGVFDFVHPADYDRWGGTKVVQCVEKRKEPRKTQKTRNLGLRKKGWPPKGAKEHEKLTFTEGNEENEGKQEWEH